VILEPVQPGSSPALTPAPSAPVYPAQSPRPAATIEKIPPRSAKGDLQGLFRPADYPIDALEHKEEGSVTVRLTVGVTGRVSACDVLSSSGSLTLDDASCAILQSRALFTPARDGTGNAITDMVSQEIRWVLG
jgi:protein TonB